MTYQSLTNRDIDAVCHHRSGEERIGQIISTCNIEACSREELMALPQKFLILGVSEDIGVRANFGRPGAEEAFDCFLSQFVNLQANAYTKTSLPLLGGKLIWRSKVDDVIELRKIVNLIDQELEPLLRKVFDAGKIPIVVGGGHNNCFPLLKALSNSRKTRVAAVNIDAHSDLRSLEGRHSGNGFSYALEKGFMSHYQVLGLQNAYTSEDIFQRMNLEEHFEYVLFEDLLVDSKYPIWTYASRFLKRMHNLDIPVGIELDVDSIANFPSSASSPIGFELNTILKTLDYLGNNHHTAYLHICEAAPSLGWDGKRIVGKALSAMILHFLN
jgi:formiminoglutamase